MPLITHIKNSLPHTLDLNGLKDGILLGITHINILH